MDGTRRSKHDVKPDKGKELKEAVDRLLQKDQLDKETDTTEGAARPPGGGGRPA